MISLLWWIVWVSAGTGTPPTGFNPAWASQVNSIQQRIKEAV